MEVEIEREGAHTNMEDADVPKLKRRGGAALHGLILVSNIFCSHGSQISPFGKVPKVCCVGMVAVTRLPVEGTQMILFWTPLSTAVSIGRRRRAPTLDGAGRRRALEFAACAFHGRHHPYSRC